MASSKKLIPVLLFASCVLICATNATFIYIGNDNKLLSYLVRGRKILDSFVRPDSLLGLFVRLLDIRRMGYSMKLLLDRFMVQICDEIQFYLRNLSQSTQEKIVLFLIKLFINVCELPLIGRVCK